VQVFRLHFSLQLQDLSDLHFLVTSGLLIFIRIRVESEFVHFDCIALRQFLHFILHYLVHNLSVHLRSRAGHPGCYLRVFKFSYNVLSTLSALK
jgi:hypothetical protein